LESGGGTVHQNASSDGYYGTNAGLRGKSSCTCPIGNSGCVDDTKNNWLYYSGTSGTDNLGFRVLPAGFRYYNGSYFIRGSYAYFWSSSLSGSSNAWDRTFGYNYATVLRYNAYRSYGLSVRCVRD
jgi:uncharacterized protein (TIGR02145 family)